MQAELIEDLRTDTHRRERKRENPPPEFLPDYRRNPVFEGARLTEHLATDLAGGLIEAFARDYAEDDRDHALAELLFSVRDLKTDYERLAAGAALESLAGRIEAGIREYPNLVSAAEALADDIPSRTPGDDSERASYAAKIVIRRIASELSKRAG